MARPLLAEVDLEAIRHNFNCAVAENPTAKTLAVVKANAYGHGAVEVARALSGLASAYAVASIEEALELRQGLITDPILLLEGVFTPDELALAEHHDFWLVVHANYQFEWIEQYLLTSHWRPQLWLKLDTGMHRLGFNSTEISDVLARLSRLDGLPEPVMMSHFACADDPERSENHKAIERFESISPRVKSFANSAALFSGLTPSDSWQRLGIGLYGGTPSLKPVSRLKPAMRLKTSVIALRMLNIGECVGYGATFKADSVRQIATIAIGYADGYPRQAQQGTPVLIRGFEAPIVGRVSMDMITIDVTDIEGVTVGDSVILFGPELVADRIAKHCNTIDYTLFSGLTARVPRRYI